MLVKVKQKSVFRNYSSFIEMKYISCYQSSKGFQYVDLLLDLQRITTCKGSKNVDLLLDLQYVDLQLDLQRITT